MLKIPNTTTIQYIQIAVVTMSAITFGISLISLSCLYTLIQKEFVKTTGESYTIHHEAFIPGTHFLGALVAGIIFRFIPLRSNKVRLILANIIYAGVFITPLFTLDFIHYLVSRFLLGFALDLTSRSVSAYINAMAPDHMRGFLMSLQPVGVVAGLFIGSFFDYFNTEANYKIPFSVVLGFLATQTLALFLIEDSGSKSSDEINYNQSILKLIRVPGSTKSLLITAMFHAFHHLSGINFLTFQQARLFQDYKNAHLMTNLSLFISLISTIACGLIVDRFGRKLMSVISSTLMATGMILLAMNRLILLGVIVCLIGFNLGLAAIPWIISTEIFPEKHVSTGFEFGVATNWLFGFVTTTLLHPLNDRYVQKMSGVYAGLCLMFTLFVSICVRETKGRPRGFQQ